MDQPRAFPVVRLRAVSIVLLHSIVGYTHPFPVRNDHRQATSNHTATAAVCSR
jgi:hypothetical protein